MEQVLIIANGELDTETAQRIAALDPQQLIAVDGGAEHCRKLGLMPNLIVGDLDSLSASTLDFFERAGVAIERHPAQKNEADLELALLRAAERGAPRVILAGALGGRLDMALANVLLLLDPRLRHLRVELWQHQQTSWLLQVPGEEIHGAPGDTLSLIPLLGAAEGITTEGLSYPLRNETLALGQTRGLSNVLTAPTARVQLHAGWLLAVHTPGRA